MPPVSRNEFRSRFWTAQLIAGNALAIKGAHYGWHDGGFLVAAAMAVVGFLLVMPLAALIVWFMLRTGLGSGPAPTRTRWVGAVATGLVLCAVVIGGALLLS
jgi:hypothetical protein